MIKINNLPKPVEIAPAKPALDEVAQRRIKLKKATQAFEAIFIEQMLKSMRASSLDKQDKEESGFGKDIMLSMADESVAKQLSKTGTFGVGEALYNNLLNRLKVDEEAKPGLQITSKRHIDGVAPVRSTKSLSDMPAAIRKDDRMNSMTREPEPTPVKPSIVDKSAAMLPWPNRSQAIVGRSEKQSRAHDRLDGYINHIRAASKESDIPEELLRAVIMQESAGDTNATSHKGAAGLMQLMPDTARSVGVQNPYDARENIMGGARYLRQMLNRFGDIETALAAYNAGPGNVEKHGGVPPFAETQEYVKRILSELSEVKAVNKSSHESDIR
ncbi:MAG: transglycosylase SLT domain-containing protein [Candidatus Zixiibacteriota bacterium]